MVGYSAVIPLVLLSTTIYSIPIFKMLWTNDMQLSESTALILLLQQFSMSKKKMFPEPDQDHDTKKALYITLLQAD